MYPDPLDWRLRANCGPESADMFFADDEDSAATATQLCATCPVRAECARTAETNHEEFGTWAGRDRTPPDPEPVPKAEQPPAPPRQLREHPTARSVLTDADIREICRREQEGTTSTRSLAAEYGVTPKTIRNYRHGTFRARRSGPPRRSHV